MPAAQFAVYGCCAKPGVGWDRAYVGFVDVELWGGGVVRVAVDARVDCHMRGGKTAAAWLRACSGPAYGVEVLWRGDDRSEAYCAELYWALRKMVAHGKFLTRGGPYCRIAVPWAEVAPLLDLVGGGATFAAFRMRLEHHAGPDWAGLPGEVVLHLQGRCYLCTGHGHIAEDCTSATASAAWPPASARTRFSPHFIPAPLSVYWEQASAATAATGGHPGRWRYAYRTGTSGRARRRRGSVCVEVDAGGVWRFRVEHGCEEGESDAFATEIACVHAAALEAAARCNIETRRQDRPAGAPGISHG